MREKIKQAIEKIDSLPKNKGILVISHFDADGITSAAIFTKALQRWKKSFSLQIVKGLDEQFIENLSENNLIIFLDLASGSLDYLKKKKTDIIILDHHEIIQEIPQNVLMINPLVDNSELISAAGVCYLFAKTLSIENTDLANLAIIGMVGDVLDKDIHKTYDEILKDSNTVVKKGLLLYPSTKPLDRSLEYSSNPFIPTVTGNYKGVIELLKDANIPRIDGRFKSLNELSEDEMSSLITAIMLRGVDQNKMSMIIGNLYLVKFFNKLEDAREFSALINACSRMDKPNISLGFCLGNKKHKENAEKIYLEYKQHIISGLKYVSETEKIQGKNFCIINAKNNIKDTVIGTIASIISQSPIYEEGTIIIALAHSEDKIKVSARIAGRVGRNVRDVLHQIVLPLGGEVGGHPKAAGCLISREKESAFIEQLQKLLEIEIIKV